MELLFRDVVSFGTDFLLETVEKKVSFVFLDEDWKTCGLFGVKKLEIPTLYKFNFDFVIKIVVFVGEKALINVLRTVQTPFDGGAYVNGNFSIRINEEGEIFVPIKSSQNFHLGFS